MGRVKKAWMVLAFAALALPATASQPQERRVVRVNAERFSFTPSRIEIDAGEEVEIRIKSDDTSHGFRIIGLDTTAVVPKRGKGEVSVVLKVEKPGRYVFECNRMCGAGHNFMRGELVVRERTTAGNGQ
jgi:cytochrome c oxidase subunit II